MTAVKPVSPNKAYKLFNEKILDTKVMNKMYKYASDNPDSFASKTALLSALTKDALGCYYYVNQSLHNDRIPEDKRNFVAALDLMNGILNIGIQLTVGLWIDNNSKKWFEKMHVGKELEKINTEKIAKKLKPIVNLSNEAKDVSAEQIEKYLRTKVLGKAGKATKWLKVGFAAAVMLTATQVVIKRMIVPFLSTPLASWYKAKYMDKKKPEPTKGRMYYEWKNLDPQNNQKIDKTAFSKISNK